MWTWTRRACRCKLRQQPQPQPPTHPRRRRRRCALEAPSLVPARQHAPQHHQQQQPLFSPRSDSPLLAV